MFEWKEMKPSILRWICFSPHLEGRISELSKQCYFHYKAEHVLRSCCLCWIDLEEDSQQRGSREREWCIPAGLRAPTRLLVWTVKCWQCQGSSAPPAGPGLDFGPFPLFLRCLKAVSVPFFSLCIHYMVVVNSSLWEGQSFKIEENNFHKNIKNGKKLLFKKFAIQSGSCWKSISLKWE